MWESLSNEKVGLIAHSFYEVMQAETAANAILSAAFERQATRPNCSEDITVIVIFFDRKLIIKNMKIKDTQKAGAGSGLL